MTSVDDELLTAFELHSVDGIRKVLDGGFDPHTRIREKPAVEWLTEMYSRSREFPACLALMLAYGAELSDPLVAPVLLDDAEAVTAMVQANPKVIDHRTTMVSAFTPLVGASLLHVAAEFGNTNAAGALIELGADVNARAATDEYGMNGHTPLFHAVNSMHNMAAPILDMLLTAGADAELRLAGITWGKGFEWETTIFDVTPVSYAQFGLLPQVHRRERDIYDNINRMLNVSGRQVPPLNNIPNRYLYPHKS